MLPSPPAATPGSFPATMRIPRPRLTLGALLILIAVAAVPLAVFAPWLNPPRAQAVIEGSPRFAFGTMPAGSYRRHAWTIRNDGRADLILVVSQLDPGCGLSVWEGENRVVPPGARAEIQMTWTTVKGEGLKFTRAAKLGTNDPDAPSLSLVVEGNTSPRDGFAPVGDPEPRP